MFVLSQFLSSLTIHQHIRQKSGKIVPRWKVEISPLHGPRHPTPQVTLHFLRPLVQYLQLMFGTSLWNIYLFQKTRFCSFKISFSEFQQLRNKYAKYILCVVHL
jgi:hypothetical protein